MTGTEKTELRIVRQGWDGKECFVHARAASDGGERVLITAQKMDVSGDDCFFGLQTAFSTDGGKTFSDFRPNESFASREENGIRTVCCDMTPMFHRATGCFIATGHTAKYLSGSKVPVNVSERFRTVPYAVFDPEKGCFGEVGHVEMPDPEKYRDCGSGCSQCLEEADGSILIPVSFREMHGGVVCDAKAAVMRCTFDGERLRFAEIGNDLEVKDEVRGIGECSVIRFGDRYYLTVRGDTYGYVCVSDDGMHFTQPVPWRWDNGEIVPTYNTQSHWFLSGGKLWLVYTRRDGKNDHVFRNRAPLYAAEADPETLMLKRDTEFVVIPERGARLGNFGACRVSDETALVIVSEWMQPAGCEKYGSNNAMWLAKISL